MTISYENDCQLKEMCKTIKRLRIQNEMTIEDVSKITLIPLDLLSAIEEFQITDSFTADMLLSLSALFHIYPSDFFKDAEE